MDNILLLFFFLVKYFSADSQPECFPISSLYASNDTENKKLFMDLLKKHQKGSFTYIFTIFYKFFSTVLVEAGKKRECIQINFIKRINKTLMFGQVFVSYKMRFKYNIFPFYKLFLYFNPLYLSFFFSLVFRFRFIFLY